MSVLQLLEHDSQKKKKKEKVPWEERRAIKNKQQNVAFSLSHTQHKKKEGKNLKQQ